jgi:hypothetical protein
MPAPSWHGCAASHQEEELVEAVKRGAVLLLIPLQVLGQPDKGNAAFVP